MSIEAGRFLGKLTRTGREEERIERISSGIRWEDAHYLKVPDEVQFGISATIDDNLSRLTKYFLLPRPRVTVIQGWNDAPPEEERPMRNAIADSFITKNLPQGIIRLSPRFLMGVATEIIQGNEGLSLLELSGIMGHEMDHLWQWNFEHTDLIRDLEVLSDEDASEAWEQTPSEQQARRFEEYWMENWQKFPA